MSLLTDIIWLLSTQSPFLQYGQNQDIFIRQKVWLPATTKEWKNFLKIVGTKTCFTNSWNCRQDLDWSKQNCWGAPLASSIPIWKGTAEWKDMKGLPTVYPDTNKAAHGHVLPFMAFYPMDILGCTCLLGILQNTVSNTRYDSAYQCFHLKKLEIKIKKFFSLMQGFELGLLGSGKNMLFRYNTGTFHQKRKVVQVHSTVCQCCVSLGHRNRRNLDLVCSEEHKTSADATILGVTMWDQDSWSCSLFTPLYKQKSIMGCLWQLHKQQSIWQHLTDEVRCH